MTALHITGFRGSLLAAQLLLSHGADPFVTNYHDQNARYHAATSGNLELLQLLMGCSGTDPAGCCPPLQGAIVNNKLECAKWLLANGADPDALDNQGLTQLHCAAVIPDRDSFIKLLVEHAANVHALTPQLETALDLAADKRESVKAVKLLIAAGADAAHIGYEDQGAIHMAVNLGHTEIVQLLLEHGAGAVINAAVMECPCCGRVTPLMASTVVPITKMLLEAGADVHIRTSRGDTCLHIAAEHSYAAPLVCLMLQAGADIGAVNNDGKTAAQIAHAKGKTLMEALLNRAAQR
jgi:ankyrin repeat protein